ncbi:MAG: YggT family protein [Cyanobacteria bacterium]|nr:YggT family protein [Cyanobacteria bacterium CG_2015-16_32_12]NCO78111.1 YggT family protein [Cyanobacteria bacterium CG_2015-22_32_23]NCQ03156.1 YggT family protein [Cyanobacteria bacterium CG_2015-09_32_10]NCQ42645.1 YggT family protein [Cyanobacteria bacterium CG_2015-04_32_10]NCS84027.1 YggT family protein [Cyanobacteria bacterium CG_2015-02_32_10]
MNIGIIASIILGILFFIMTILFIFRIILTWYPNVNLTQFPYKLAYIPTEPFLLFTRKLIPPLGGIDITPIVWLGIFTLLREILLGQQGLLTLAIRHNTL